MAENAIKPKFLYKYQPINIYTLENLSNSQIFFSAASEFNDPFDCSISLLHGQEDTTNKNAIIKDILKELPEHYKYEKFYLENGELDDTRYEEIASILKRIFL